MTDSGKRPLMVIEREGGWLFAVKNGEKIYSLNKLTFGPDESFLHRLSGLIRNYGEGKRFKNGALGWEWEIHVVGEFGNWPVKWIQLVSKTEIIIGWDNDDANRRDEALQLNKNIVTICGKRGSFFEDIGIPGTDGTEEDIIERAVRSGAAVDGDMENGEDGVGEEEEQAEEDQEDEEEGEEEEEEEDQEEVGEENEGGEEEGAAEVGETEAGEAGRGRVEHKEVEHGGDVRGERGKDLNRTADRGDENRDAVPIRTFRWTVGDGEKRRFEEHNQAVAFHQEVMRHQRQLRESHIENQREIRNAKRFQRNE